MKCAEHVLSLPNNFVVEAALPGVASLTSCMHRSHRLADRLHRLLHPLLCLWVLLDEHLDGVPNGRHRKVASLRSNFASLRAGHFPLEPKPDGFAHITADIA